MAVSAVRHAVDDIEGLPAPSRLQDASKQFSAKATIN